MGPKTPDRDKRDFQIEQQQEAELRTSILGQFVDTTPENPISSETVLGSFSPDERQVYRRLWGGFDGQDTRGWEMNLAFWAHYFVYPGLLTTVSSNRYNPSFAITERGKTLLGKKKSLTGHTIRKEQDRVHATAIRADIAGKQALLAVLEGHDDDELTSA